MDALLKKKVMKFVTSNIVDFHERRYAALEMLTLKTLLGNKNPYLFRAKYLESASSLVSALLDARISSSEEGIFGKFLEELAIFVASETGDGKKSGITGVDVEIDRNNVRYLIAVKSGKNWGNSTQHARLKQNFKSAVKVLRQSKQSGQIQPTLGICYGKFKTVDNGEFLHIGGQSFWEILSGDSDFYIDIIEPLGYEAEKHNSDFLASKLKLINRLTREFTISFCDAQGAICWDKLVRFVSENMSLATNGAN